MISLIDIQCCSEASLQRPYSRIDSLNPEDLWNTMDKCHYGLKPGGILAMNVANTKRIKNFEEETLKLARMVHFKHIDTWYLYLSSQSGKTKREPIFIFKK